MAFSLLKRALTFFVMFIFMLSYSRACEPHAAVFDKLLQALTASNLMSQVLKLWWSSWCFIWPVCKEALA